MRYRNGVEPVDGSSHDSDAWDPDAEPVRLRTTDGVTHDGTDTVTVADAEPAAFIAVTRYWNVAPATGLISVYTTGVIDAANSTHEPQTDDEICNRRSTM